MAPWLSVFGEVTLCIMWPWRRRKPGRHWHPPAPIPDGDTVLHPGDRRSADILRSVLEEPTQQLPTYRPLMTPGQQWRANGGRP